MASTPDHRPYSEGPAKLAFGLNAESRLVHVRDAERGKACDCVCPAPTCRRPLIARRAKTWHFAHEAGSNCSHAYESMLHRLAKEVLEETLRLDLPAVRAQEGDLFVEPHPAREMTFESARLEVRLDGITPDIIVTHQGHELIVEILVTHACDEAKIAKLRESGVAAIEIDLSRLPRTADREVVHEAVTKTAPRAWLYNKKLDEAVEQLKAKQAEAERLRLQGVGRTADRLAQNWDRLTATPPRPPSPQEEAFLEHLATLRLRSLIGHDIRGQAGFTVTAAVWQAEVVRRLIVSPPHHVHIGPRKGVRRNAIVADLLGQGLVHKMFDTERDQELIGLTQTRRPNFATPYAALETYLRHLAKLGHVICEDGLWRGSDTARDDTRARTIELEEERDRIGELQEALSAILDRIGPHAVEFDREAWLEGDFPGYGQSPREVARCGLEPWETLQEALGRIVRAFDRENPALETLSLPVLPAIQAAAIARAEAAETRRLREEERQRQAQARELELADDREAKARSRARTLPDLETFLAEPIASNRPVTRLEHLRTSDAGLWDILVVVDGRLHRQRQAAERQAIADEQQILLRKAAVAAHDEAWADLFMVSQFPELGGRRPNEVCVDADSRKRCEKLVHRKGRARR